MSETLTLQEFMALFDRPPVDGQWLASVDSAEYLSVVTWLVHRSNAR